MSDEVKKYGVVSVKASDLKEGDIVYQECRFYKIVHITRPTNIVNITTQFCRIIVREDDFVLILEDH